MRHISDCALKSFRYMNVSIDVPVAAVAKAANAEGFESVQTARLNRDMAFLTLNEFQTFLPEQEEILGSSQIFKEQLSWLAIWLLARGVNHYPVPLCDMTVGENRDKKHMN